jgi:hypothetical protein
MEFIQLQQKAPVRLIERPGVHSEKVHTSRDYESRLRVVTLLLVMKLLGLKIKTHEIILFVTTSYMTNTSI